MAIPFTPSGAFTNPVQAAQAIAFDYNRRTYNATVVPALARKGIEFGVNVSMMEAIETTGKQILSAGGAIADEKVGITTITRFLRTAVRARRERFRSAMNDVGLQALRAVNDAYRPVNKISYREDDGRLSGGKLKRAINSPNMFRAAPDGIAFINRAWLDNQAAHWYRLNFGAGSKASLGRRPKNQTMRFFGEVVGSYGLEGFPPSPSFRIPPGWFGGTGKPTPLGGATGQRFDPLRNIRKISNPQTQRAAFSVAFRRSKSSQGAKFTSIQSRGIAAMGFLDAGVSSIARNMPAAYTFLFREILRESIDNPAQSLPAQKAIDAADVERTYQIVQRQIDRFNSSLGGNVFGILQGRATR